MWTSDWGSGMFDEFLKQNMVPRIDVMLIHNAQLLSIGREERSWFPVFMIFKYELSGPWVSRTQQPIKLPFYGAEVLMWNETSQPALGYKNALLQVDSRNEIVNFKQVKGKQQKKSRTRMKPSWEMILPEICEVGRGVKKRVEALRNVFKLKISKIWCSFKYHHSYVWHIY